MNQHATKRISVKSAPVDEGMIPVVKWLNSLDSVATTHCCEGEYKSGECSRPYVVFWCLQFETVLEIVRKIRGYAECRIFYPEDSQPFRYDLRFNSKKFLEKFIEFLEWEKQR